MLKSEMFINLLEKRDNLGNLNNLIKYININDVNDVDEYNFTLLHYIAKSSININKEKIAIRLLCTKANPYKDDGHGVTPFRLAILSNNYSILKNMIPFVKTKDLKKELEFLEKSKDFMLCAPQFLGFVKDSSELEVNKNYIKKIINERDLKLFTNKNKKTKEKLSLTI